MKAACIVLGTIAGILAIAIIVTIVYDLKEKAKSQANSKSQSPSKYQSASTPQSAPKPQSAQNGMGGFTNQPKNR